MEPNNIVLIGMPGVGKSTVGVIIAKELGYQFLDSDLVIQQQEGKLLREIIEEVGAEGFIEIENRVNAAISARHSVIATGGSAVYGREAMEHLCAISTIVYLETDFPVIEKRLADIRGRGVVLRSGQKHADIFEERVPLYRRYADITVNVTELSVEQTVQILLQKIQFLNSNH